MVGNDERNGWRGGGAVSHPCVLRACLTGVAKQLPWDRSPLFVRGAPISSYHI